jgi:hypothetical protein
VLVAEVLNNGDRLVWFGMDFDNYDQRSGESQKIFSTISLQDALVKDAFEGLEFRSYIWNPNKDVFEIYEYEVSARPGNPYRYALFQDFRR